LDIENFDLIDLQKEQVEFGEFEWLNDYDVFGDAAAEVPQLPASYSQPNHTNTASIRQTKSYSTNYKKPRYDLSLIEEDDDEHFTVPDLG